jgi:type II secretory pathway component PulF
MIEIGARSNDLPAVLTLLADHYHRANDLWTRLKGLMVYPVLVILVSLGLTLLISLNITRFLSRYGAELAQQPLITVPIAVLFTSSTSCSPCRCAVMSVPGCSWTCSSSA